MEVDFVWFDFVADADAEGLDWNIEGSDHSSASNWGK